MKQYKMLLMLLCSLCPILVYAQAPGSDSLPAADIHEKELKAVNFETSYKQDEYLDINKEVVNYMVHISDRETSTNTPFENNQPKKLELYISPNEESKLIINLSETEEPEGKYISGPTKYDSRIETRQLNPRISWQDSIIENAGSVGIVIEKNMLHRIADSFYQVDAAITLEQRYNLCPGIPFGTQPVVGVGTAFVIGDQELMTAAHVFEGPPENYALIFGFEMATKAGAFESIIPAAKIYFPDKIQQLDDQLDVCTFRTERPLGRKTLKLANKLPADKTEIYMIGFPSGLPQKIALNANIIDNRHQSYCYTSLDAFQGNSGSPVFDINTHEVIGILVSGQTDYQWLGSCYTYTLCRAPYCEGEKVIRSIAIAEMLSTKNMQ